MQCVATVPVLTPCSVWLLYQCCLYSVVPGPVGNLSLFAVNSTAVRVTWVDPVITNGRLQHFTIEYAANGSSSGGGVNATVPFSPDNSTSRYIIGGLEVFTLYDITVAAVTGGGTGSAVSRQKRTLPTGELAAMIMYCLVFTPLSSWQGPPLLSM